jgi:hypothetical protein
MLRIDWDAFRRVRRRRCTARVPPLLRILLRKAHNVENELLSICVVTSCWEHILKELHIPCQLYLASCRVPKAIGTM